MRSLITIMLLFTLCLGFVCVVKGEDSVVSKNLINSEQTTRRFIWADNLIVPAGEIVSLDPVNTVGYKTMVIHVDEINHQPFSLAVFVESRLYPYEDFRVTTLIDGSKTRFDLSNVTIEEPAQFICGIYGAETKLDLVNTGTEPITIRISCVLSN